MPKIEVTEVMEEAIGRKRKLLLPLVLDELNDIRTAVAIGEGKLTELPKGIRGNTKSCVIARALSNGWQSRVGTEGMNLTHSPDENGSHGEIDFNKIIATLEQQGFDAEWESSMGHWVIQEEGPDTWEPRTDVDVDVLIQHTWLTRSLMMSFDNDEFPELFENPGDPSAPADFWTAAQEEPVETD